jgi:hypothetical protein
MQSVTISYICLPMFVCTYAFTHAGRLALLWLGMTLQLSFCARMRAVKRDKALKPRKPCLYLFDLLIAMSMMTKTTATTASATHMQGCNPLTHNCSIDSLHSCSSTKCKHRSVTSMMQA